MDHDQFNPYAAATPTGETPTYSQQQPISAAVVDQLRRTGGWARLFSVLLWIAGGIILLFAIGFLIVGGAVLSSSGDPLSKGGGAIAGVTTGVAVFYGLLSLIYIYPALKLGKYAKACRQISTQPTEDVLVDALDQQRAFWKYAGIWTTVFLVFGGITFILGALSSFMAAASATP